jgi:hypothetical protein
MTTRRFCIRQSAKAPALRPSLALACAVAALGSACAPVGQIAPVVATASPSGSVIERVARTAGLAVGLGGNPAQAGPVPTAEVKVTYEMKLYGEINEESLPAFDPRAVCLAPHKEEVAAK